MTDSTNDNASEDLATVELDNLKERAKLLGLKFHPSIGADALREKLREFQAAVEVDASDSPKVDSPAPSARPAVETSGQKIARIKAAAEKLVRVRITCMNPAKKDWQGEIFTVSNRAVGTLKRFVPFNADEGWHVPQMMLDVLRARECQIFVKEKSRLGVEVKRGKLIREFAIEIMDPLTTDEISELARRQAMEAGKTA